MAKKKNKTRKKRPPGGPRPSGAGASRPAGTPAAAAAAAAGADTARDQRRTAARERREAELRRRRAQARRKQMRNAAIITAIVAAIAAFAVVRAQQGARKEREANRLAAAAGCSKVQTTATSGADAHLRPGERATYDPSPPTHGSHDPAALTAGVHREPLSEDPAATGPTIYKAVHSLEHGYVLLWHNGASDAELSALEKRFGDERKVIIAPYPKLKAGTKLALTSWGRIQTCSKPDHKVVSSFISRFRESDLAPEPKA